MAGGADVAGIANKPALQGGGFFLVEAALFSQALGHRRDFFQFPFLLSGGAAQLGTLSQPK